MAISFSAIARVCMPGLVFQGVVVGGGYATGRELVEFFLSHGVIGALLALATSIAIWSVVLAVAFDYAHISHSYDYNTLLSSLLGPFRVLFEIIYVMMMFLVVAVISGAAGEIFAARTGAPGFLGVALLTGIILIAVFLPNRIIARLISFWSVLLYVAYVLIFVFSFSIHGGDIANVLTAGEVKSTWPSGAIAYTGYNLAALPATLFILQTLRSRKEAISAGR